MAFRLNAFIACFLIALGFTGIRLGASRAPRLDLTQTFGEFDVWLGLAILAIGCVSLVVNAKAWLDGDF